MGLFKNVEPIVVARNDGNGVVEFTDNQPAQKSSDNAPKCPNCGSKNIQLLGQNKKAFSAGKAIGGAILTGGIGLLAGFAGKKGKFEWICMECSKRFQLK